MSKLKSIRRRMDRTQRICSCCGEPVDNETLDVEQFRPGPYARLSRADKALCTSGSDVVTIPRGIGGFDTDTWFVRCILYLPIQDAAPLRVGAGLWARVTPEDGWRYLREFARHRGVFPGTLDGDVPVHIKSKPGRERPRLVIQNQSNPSAWAEHLLKWQLDGFPSVEEAHQFTKAFVHPSNGVVPRDLS